MALQFTQYLRNTFLFEPAIICIENFSLAIAVHLQGFQFSYQKINNGISKYSNEIFQWCLIYTTQWYAGRFKINCFHFYLGLQIRSRVKVKNRYCISRSLWYTWRHGWRPNSQTLGLWKGRGGLIDKWEFSWRKKIHRLSVYLLRMKETWSENEWCRWMASDNGKDTAVVAISKIVLIRARFRKMNARRGAD